MFRRDKLIITLKRSTLPQQLAIPWSSLLHFGLYTVLPSPILYSVWHTAWFGGGGRMLRNGRAIVLQQGRLCRWPGATTGWLTPKLKL